jgi:hypothetical protein
MGNIIHLTTEGLAHFQVSFDSLADTSSHPPSDDETEQTTAAAPTSAPIVALSTFQSGICASRFRISLPISPTSTHPIGRAPFA